MQKWFRITLIVSGSLLVVLVLLWLGLALYIRHNKADILQQINDKLSDRLHGGTLAIEDMEPSLVHSFPNVSVALEGVTIKDSLWNTHRHPLLDVSRIFVEVNTFSLLRKQLDIRRISLEKGRICLFTDSTGYSNTSILKRHTHVKAEGNKGKAADITRLELSDISFIIENQQKHKLFSFDIADLKGNLRNNDTGWACKVSTSMRVLSFAFNTEKGSYLKDKPLQTNLEISYNRVSKILEVPQQAMRIAGQTISVGASFSFGELPRAFTVHIVADKIPFRLAASLLTPKIASKLDSINIEQPIDVEAQLKGHTKPGDKPAVYVTWKTADNVVTTKGMELQECSFAGSFSNEWKPGEPRVDENSVISLYGLKAKIYNSIPVAADTVHITNLKHPTLMGYFRSAFSLADLNEAQGEEGLFKFTGGTAVAALYYKGGITAGDTIIPYLKGTVELKHGVMEYTPRNLQFSGCNALLDFNGQDLALHNITISTRKSSLQMEGSVQNITRLYFTAPEKLQLNWNVRSTGIDLDEFRSFLGKRSNSRRGRAVANRRNTSRIASQLDVMFNTCNINMDLQLDKLTYGNFTAQQVRAAMSLKDADIQLQRMSLLHAGGSVDMKGTMTQDGVNNRFKINTNIRNVHIDQLFHAFNNFGMQSLSSKNLKGIFSATAAVSGNIKDNGKMAPQSMYGTLTFDLRNGALVHFAPLEDIGGLLFRGRNLGNITFDNLKNTLTLQGNKIIVPPMQINSSALYMDVSGVYAMTRGTDMFITVPLRNPKRDEDIVDKEEKKSRRHKGIVLHLRAKDGEDGKVKIKLGSKKDKPEEAGM